MANERSYTGLRTFLRAYGVVTVALFSALFVGFTLQFPPLGEGGALNWFIWNGTQCGDQPCHVPPMLFSIYVVWGVFFLLAARRPLAYMSFLNFTMVANFVHAMVMLGQALLHLNHYWSKFFTDIPFTLGIALGIYLLRPKSAESVEHLPARQQRAPTE